ncbi:wax ester/triacylglycerol synthase family O-acyltransferase [Rhodococcus sp. ACPA1]|uniref:WS/DGAT/MGAT family O-acyltransferase n=1 Tax=Rhodococcus sp. ACPA1 TaxID=2028572 RepID=UPI000BB11AA8|nr:wax ester/triacylglycerol synthase family O-acyltransferase [Rhodococcus sp. ACPA1]PBC49732.1 wax ester/triacylglycerol synthase family O-acyltransferase [Rhodococcus sp. ACPA1]
MPVTDSIFLLGESREHPMHVGSLELFTPPEDAGPDYVKSMHETLLKHTDVDPTFRKKPAGPVGSLGNLWWADESDVDLEYHVRHSALPAPYRVRELLTLTSRLHGTLLDRHRPLWEMYLIEGLSDGRFAIYTKLHHSLMDGVSGLRLLMRTLSTDPDVRDAPPPWNLPRRASANGAAPAPDLWSVVNGVRRTVGEVAGLAPASLRIARTAIGQHDMRFPYEAPRTMLNVPIGGARRFAAQSWPLERVHAVRKAAGVSVNDVVMAMCAGALRGYLEEQNALPDEPLIAMVPVSLRDEQKADAGGNAVGVTLCNLATDVDDPAERLTAISASMCQGKELFGSLTSMQALAWSAFNMSPIALTPVPGFVRFTPPPFNVIISNVPGPRKTMYWNGSRLDGIYPTSVVLDGQALNITLTTNGGNLDFGVIGCRRSVPSLQRILFYLETALGELEAALL